MPPQFKDPLWPEPPVDIWRGGRPLAPYRPPKPPMPPEPKPNELEHWFPQDGLEPQPKADPQQGQPVGPAFAQMPRDFQREAVNQTYGDMVKGYLQRRVAEAGKMTQGPFHAQGAIDQAAGGAMGSMGVVHNESSPYFQSILKEMPWFATPLRKMEQSVEYLPPVKRLANYLGLTTGLSKPLTPTVRATLESQAAVSRIPSDGVRALSPAKILDLADRGPGATVQRFPEAIPPTNVTKAHEGFHSIYALQNPEGQVPRATGDRALQLMGRVLRRSGLSVDDSLKIMQKYANDPSHGLVEALGQWTARKGGMNVR